MKARAGPGLIVRGRRPRLLSALPVLLAAGFFVVDLVPGSAVSARQRVHRAAGFLRLDSEEARERVFGTDYARAIAEIRRVLPEGAAYVLAADGAVITDFVAYDLAPRRALLVDGERPTVRTLRDRANASGLPRFTVVVPGAGSPPRLVSTSALTGAR